MLLRISAVDSNASDGVWVDRSITCLELLLKSAHAETARVCDVSRTAQSELQTTVDTLRASLLEVCVTCMSLSVNYRERGDHFCRRAHNWLMRNTVQPCCRT